MKLIPPDMMAARTEGINIAAEPPSRVKAVNTIHTSAGGVRVQMSRLVSGEMTSR